MNTITTTLTINNTALSIKEYNGQRVVTFKDIDTVHQRPEGTAGRNFRTNREHFIDGEDYYKITPDEFRRTIGNMDKRQTNNITLITETGYLMLVKSFTDELAWQVQRELVNTYFRSRSQLAPTTSPQNTYTYFDKIWNGEKVITLRDFEHFTGITQSTLSYYLKTDKFIADEDYYLLEGTQLQRFKNFNTKFPKRIYHIILLTYKGCVKLVQLFKLGDEPVAKLNTVGMFELPAPEENETPQWLHLRQSPEAVDLISTMKDELTSLNTIVNKMDRNNLHIDRMNNYSDTLQALAMDFLCHAMDLPNIQCPKSIERLNRGGVAA